MMQTITQALKPYLHVTCVECGRVFDLTNENDASDHAYGHDCEAS